jgi:hypothetical protein
VRQLFTGVRQISVAQTHLSVPLSFFWHPLFLPSHGLYTLSANVRGAGDLLLGWL